MRRIVEFIGGTILLICASGTSDAANKPGAGALLFTTIQGTHYVLLADHKHGRRGWASFGGRLEKQSPIDAAAREVEEETKGILKREWVRSQLEKAKSHRERDGEWHYTTYVLQIPYTPAITFEATIPPKYLKGAQERGPYTWIPAAELMKALKKYRNGKSNISFPRRYLPQKPLTDRYWDRFLQSMDKLDEAGKLPWD